MSHRITHAVVTSIAALLAVTGCDEQLPTTTDSPSATAAVGGNNPVVLSVKGSGMITALGTVAPYIGEDEWRTFTVNATKRADGSVSGHTQYNSRINGGSLQQSTVVCMRDLSSIPASATLPAPLGWVLVGAEVNHRVSDFAPEPFLTFPAAIVGVDHGILFVVKDNGEGAGAAPDMITTAVNTNMATVRTLCTPGTLNSTLRGLLSPGSPNTKAIEAGNIQVSTGN